MAVLILSIVSWVFCPIIPAIVALAMAPGARRKIAESGGRLEGESLVKVGVIVSWINIGLYGLGLVIFIIVVIAAAASDNDALQILQTIPIS